MLRGFPPLGDVPTTMPVLDWVKLLPGQHVAGLADKSGQGFAVCGTLQDYEIAEMVTLGYRMLNK